MARSVIMTMFDLQCEYVEYNTNSEILKAVENGEVDYGICHEAVAEKIIEKENLSVVPSLTIMNSFLTFGVWEDKEELRDQMNTILKYYANQAVDSRWLMFLIRIAISVKNLFTGIDAGMVRLVINNQKWKPCDDFFPFTVIRIRYMVMYPSTKSLKHLFVLLYHKQPWALLRCHSQIS